MHSKHTSRSSTTTFNVEAKEFKFNPAAAFNSASLSSSFSFSPAVSSSDADRLDQKTGYRHSYTSSPQPAPLAERLGLDSSIRSHNDTFASFHLNSGSLSSQNITTASDHVDQIQPTIVPKNLHTMPTQKHVNEISALSYMRYTISRDATTEKSSCKLIAVQERPKIRPTKALDRFVCSTCNKAFSRSSSLRIHSHSHTGDTPFKCSRSGCGKAFSVRSNMKRHERTCYASAGTSPMIQILPHQNRHEYGPRGDNSSRSLVDLQH